MLLLLSKRPCVPHDCKRVLDFKASLGLQGQQGNGSIDSTVPISIELAMKKLRIESRWTATSARTGTTAMGETPKKPSLLKEQANVNRQHRQRRNDSGGVRLMGKKTVGTSVLWINPHEAL
jgi:hypothetical protein